MEEVIAPSDVPMERLVAAPGAMRGRIQLMDDFDAPLDELFEALG